MRFTSVLIGLIFLFASPLYSFAASDQPYLSQGASMTGSAIYAQGRWGVVRSVLVNPTDHAVSPLLAVDGTRAPNLQFCWRTWLAPHSRRVVVSPFYPQNIRQTSKAISVEARLIDDSQGADRLLDQKPSLLILNHRDLVTAVVGASEAAHKLVRKLRVLAGWAKSSVSIRAEQLPAQSQMMGLVGTMVICQHGIELSSQQLNSLRDWLVHGGRLWIMLDQTGPGFARRLLESNWRTAIVDRVGLTHLTLSGPGGKVSIQRDYPLQLLRVVAPRSRVIYRVNGYPVVMSQPLGKGIVFVSTVAPTALLAGLSRRPKALAALAGFFSLGHNVLDNPRHAAAAEYAGIRGYARRQVGYQILGRGPVAVILAVLTVLLAGLGVFFDRRGRLEIAALVGGVLTVVAAGVLMGMGLSEQSGTPTTLVSTRLAQVDTTGRYVNARFAVAVYRAPSLVGARQTVRGEAALPIVSTLPVRAQLVRLIWRDPDHWHFQGLSLTSGTIHTFGLTQVLRLAKPVTATVRFSARGLVGTFRPGQFGPLHDAVVVTATGALAPRFTSPTSFTIGTDAQLPSGQYFSTGVLSQTQIARQRVYHDLVGRRGFPSRPMLLGWGKASDKMPVSLSIDALDRRATLLVLPLRFRPSKPGTTVTIPSALLPMKPYRAPGAPSNTIYDPRNAAWMPNINHPATVIMGYRLPRAVRPLHLHDAWVTIDLDGPGRSYAIVTMRHGQVVTLFKDKGLVGRKVVHLSGGQLPAISARGDVLVGLHVGPSANGGGMGWSLRLLSVAAAGTVQGREDR